ncbi:MAG: hybrid sensor histidine kinase/response regulator [Minisyncoccales bacterium]
MIDLIQVMHVEDDELVADVTKDFFDSTKEFVLVTVSSPKEAVEVAKTNKFDVIICDYQMPEMNGIELLGILRSGPSKNVPFILFTGKIKEMSVSEAVKNEIFYYVPKGNEDSLDELVYVSKAAAAKKKSVDFPVNVLEKMQLLNSTTLHDWRNIDSALVNYIGLIENSLNDQKSIKAMCDKMNSIINKSTRLRNESKIFHQVGSENEWYLLKEVIPILPNDYGFEIFNEIPENIEIFVNLSMLKTVFEILLDNSHRHGQRVTKINFSFIKEDERVLFVYKDNGVGIVPGNKSKIFTRGFGSNTGLGLFLGRELVRMSRGDIEETGTFGEGACFEIIVPFWRYRGRFKKQ